MHFDLTISFEGIATLLAGTVALLVYSLHRKDEKKKAAIILLSEIREAEHSVGEIQRSGTVSDYTSVMSEDHWKEYQYLFATSLDADEIDLINSFYKSCKVIQDQLALIKSYLPLSMEEKVRATQKLLIELADRTKDKSEFDNEKSRILDKAFWVNTDWFEPSAPKTKLISYINGVQFIIQTNAGTKLKKIANAPYWKLFI